MNCSEIEEFLPLYAGNDLSARREQLIAAHLESCSACSGAAAEYREAREMIHSFAPPAFSDELYAEIRKSVWQQIEAQPKAPSLFESIAAWFQPRFVLTAATALLITLSVMGVYFVTKRSTVRQENIAGVPKTGPETDNRSRERLDIIFSHLDEGAAGQKVTTGQRQADLPKRQQKSDRITAPDRGNSLLAYSPDAQVGTAIQRETGAQPSRLPTQASETLALQSPGSPVIGTDNLDFATRGAEKTLRLELQTKNPNIRIIWFAPTEPKPGAVHPKGI